MTNRAEKWVGTALGFVLIVGCVGWVGCSTLPPLEPEKSSSEQSETVSNQGTPRSEWLQSLPDSLGTELCAENEVFRTCYSVGEDECLQRARERIVSCEHELEPTLPSNIRDDQTSQFGGSIGQCAGEGLFNYFDETMPLIETDSCKKLLDDT